MQTRDQKYATAIFKQVELIEQQTKEKTPENKAYRNAYGSMAHKLPVLIRSAGLTQALEFVAARGKPPHQDLLKNLSQVVLGNDASLRDRARGATQLSDYMRLTHEAMAALLWYKRFAQSVLDIDPSQANQIGEDEI